MATQVYRVTSVQTAASSPVARLQGLDEDGHEFRLEVPVALVQRTAPGHVLVLNWSLHALPEAPAAAQPQAAAEPAPLTSAASPVPPTGDALIAALSHYLMVGGV